MIQVIQVAPGGFVNDFKPVLIFFDRNGPLIHHKELLHKLLLSVVQEDPVFIEAVNDKLFLIMMGDPRLDQMDGFQNGLGHIKKKVREIAFVDLGITDRFIIFALGFLYGDRDRKIFKKFVFILDQVKIKKRAPGTSVTVKKRMDMDEIKMDE